MATPTPATAATTTGSYARRVVVACVAVASVCLVFLNSGDLSHFGRVGEMAERGRRRLSYSLSPATWLGKTQYIEWHTGESTETVDGNVPVTTCPAGKYRISGGDFDRTNGQRIEGCKFCPRGKYGETDGLMTSSCTSLCPKGRYRDTQGAITKSDCWLCPPGKVGDEDGLLTSECNGNCPSGYYSDVAGITDAEDCKVCPRGYRGWQCTWAQLPRRGTFVPNDGMIHETTDGSNGQVAGIETHAYVDGKKIPQGNSWVTFDHFYTPLDNAQTEALYGPNGFGWSQRRRRAQEEGFELPAGTFSDAKERSDESEKS